jgi:hypothetical protein
MYQRVKQNFVRLLPARSASKLLIGLFSLIIGFHLLVVTGFIPNEIVWGGKLSSSTEILRFEILSILVNLLLLAVILMDAGFIKNRLPSKFLEIMLWFMVVLFLLNTVGNLYSTNRLETLIFTPVTLILALLCYRLILGKLE